MNGSIDLRGYIVGNGDRTKWRAWRDGLPVWVDDPAEATRYSFRSDANAVHAEDEDAWCVVEYKDIATPSARITGDKGGENPAEGAPYGEGLIGRIDQLEHDLALARRGWAYAQDQQLRLMTERSDARVAMRRIADAEYADHLSGNENFERLQRLARQFLAAMQADAAPVTWMPIETAPKDGTFILLHEILAQPPVSVGCYDHECGWLIAEADFMPSKCIPHHWMPLPAAPVDDRVSTSSPVDDRASPETSGKLRDAVEVWVEAVNANIYADDSDLASQQAAASVIEADRAALVAEIVAWLRGMMDTPVYPDLLANELEASEWRK